jgi:hypothetical protein
MSRRCTQLTKFIMWMMWVTQSIVHSFMVACYRNRESLNALTCDSCNASRMTSYWICIAVIILISFTSDNCCVIKSLMVALTVTTLSAERIRTGRGVLPRFF